MKNTYTFKKRLSLVFCILSLGLFSQPAINNNWAFNNRNLAPQGSNVDNRGILTDASGNIYIAGYFSYTADFDPGAGTTYLQSNGNADIYFAKYTSTGTLIWAKSIGGTGGDNAYSMTSDASGNIYLVGNFNSTVDFDPGAGVQLRTSVGNSDIFCAKYDANGNFVFASTVGGTLTDNGYAVAVSGTNVYVGGNFYNTVDFDPGIGTQTITAAGSSPDAFLLKLDLNGNYIGAFGFGGNLSDIVMGLYADASNNILLTGNFSGTTDFDPSAASQNLVSSGSGDIYIAKYNSSLNYVYAVGMGGTGNDQANAITCDGLGNAYITGNFNGTADMDPSATTNTIVSTGFTDIFYGKYDSMGNYIYAYGIGGAMSDNAYAIKTDASGNVYITGPYYSAVDFDASAAVQTMTATAGADIYVAKYDVNGAYVSANSFGNIGTDMGWALYVDASNNLFVAGNFGSTIDFDPSASTNNLTAGGSYTNVFFAKYNSTGAFQLAKCIGDIATGGLSESAQAVTRDAAGNIYMTGNFTGIVDFDPSAATATLASVTTTASTTMDAFIAKYDANGNYVWAKQIGGSATELGYSIKTDASGNVFVTGYFNSADCDFDPSAATFSLATQGNYDIFVAKYDANGNYLAAINVGGATDDRVTTLAVDALSNVYIGGYVNGPVDMDPGAAVASFTPAGNADGYFAKYTNSLTYVTAGLVGGINSDQVWGIEVDALGNIVIGGYYNGTADMDPGASVQNLVTAGSTDIFFAKYTNAGAYVFAKSIGGTSGDVISDMTIDISGNIYVTGYFGNNNTDFDPGAGVKNLTFLGGSGDIFVSKYDDNGNYIYAGAMSGTTFENSSAIVTDSQKNAYVTGYFGSTTDFDPSPAVKNLVSSGGNDIYVAKLDSMGNFVYAFSVGSINSDVANGIEVIGTNTVILTGAFTGNVDFDPSTNVNMVSTFNSQDMFLAMYNECSAMSASLTAQNNVLCNGGATGSATVAAIGGSGLTYSWTPSGGTATTAAGLTAGMYTLTTSNSCGSKATQTVNISEPSSFTLNATVSNATVCANSTVTLTGNASGGTGTITYTWTGNPTGSVAIVTATANSTYTVNITDANNCSGTQTVNIYVNASPTVTAVSSTSLLCVGQQATLTASGATSYTWSTSTASASIVVSPTVNTSYSITATDANGCVGTANLTQSVSVCTGVNEMQLSSNVSVYPNPNKGIFFVEMQLSGKETIEVMNTNGQVLQSIKAESATTKIDLEGLASGLYLIKVSNAQNANYFKIVKE
jgi:hypothetical protein